MREISEIHLHKNVNVIIEKLSRYTCGNNQDSKTIQCNKQIANLIIFHHANSNEVNIANQTTTTP